jgi:hypothetical protein
MHPDKDQGPRPMNATDPSIDEIRQSLSAPYVAPRNDLERALAGIWQESLGVAEIGVMDDFFELGGYSLLAIEIGAQIRKQMSVEFLMSDFLRLSTIARQAEAIAQTLSTLAKTHELGNLLKAPEKEPDDF